MGPQFLHWIKNQFYDPQGAKFTAMITFAFVLVSVGWHFTTSSSQFSEMQIERLQMIDQHFTLDPSDLENGRYHVLVSHSLMYNDLLHTIVMALSMLFFGTFVEKRLGSLVSALVFFGGVALGGFCQIAVADPVWFSSIQSFFLPMAEGESAFSGIVQNLLSSLQQIHESTANRNRFSGPAGGVSALMMFALFQHVIHHRSNIVLLGGISLVWIIVDWLGFFHFESHVGLTSRITGASFGLVASIIFWLATLSRLARFRVRNVWRYPSR